MSLMRQSGKQRNSGTRKGKRYFLRDKAQNSPGLLQTNANILSVQKKLK